MPAPVRNGQAYVGSWHLAASAPPARARVMALAALAVAFTCGLAMPFNLILYSVGGQDLRLLDVICLALTPVALWTCLHRVNLLLALVLLGLMFVLPTLVHAMVLLAQQDDYRDFVFPLRFLLALSLCATLTSLLEGARNRSWFAAGVCIGCALNIVPLVFQSLGYNDTLVSLGLAPSELDIPWWDIQLRPPGLHGHANATSAAVSLAIPVATFMATQHRRYWLMPVAIAALLACSYYTETRSAVGISLATIGTAAAVRFRPDRALLLVPALILAGLLAAGWSGGPLLPESFTRLDSAGDNLSERFATMTTGLRLTLEHPFGLGRTLGTEAIYEATGLHATHNALVWLGIAVGLAPAILTLVALLGSACQAARPGIQGLRGLLAFHLFGLCFFEDHFQTQPFMALLILLLGGWIAERLASLEAARYGVPAAHPVADGGR